ncbi:hypothetical protein M405DRAFT_822365 [Rhizopogon salebrosus TDB-379]|nr:hypothetical protein M405DRAFT_822365 [Rhizopogon salebrosus TDB-379]
MPPSSSTAFTSKVGSLNQPMDTPSPIPTGSRTPHAVGTFTAGSGPSKVTPIPARIVSRPLLDQWQLYVLLLVMTLTSLPLLS